MPAINDLLTSNTVTVADEAIKVIEYATGRLADGAQAAKPMAELVIQQYAISHGVRAAMVFVALIGIFALATFIWRRTKIYAAQKFMTDDATFTNVGITVAYCIVIGAGIITPFINVVIPHTVQALTPHYSILMEIIQAAK